MGRDVEYIAKHIASREPSGRPRAHALVGARRPEVALKAFESLDADEQVSPERDLIDLIDRYNRSGDDGCIIKLPGDGD